MSTPIAMTMATTCISMSGCRALPGTRIPITTIPSCMPILTGRICITVTTMIRSVDYALERTAANALRLLRYPPRCAPQPPLSPSVSFLRYWR
jgi:hypothetical protein